MKKYLILTITLVLVLLYNAKAFVYNTALIPPVVLVQQGVDTEKYIREHVAGLKENFRHKELNVMLSKLNLTVKSYSIAGTNVKLGQPFKYLDLHFEDNATTYKKMQRHHSTPILTISFEGDIPRKKALSLYVKSFGVWSQAEKDYYGKLIVKDIAFINPGKN